MLTFTPARIGGRTRRALLAAALGAASLPAAADAATITTAGSKDGTTLHYRAAAGEVNDVRVSLPGARIVVSDRVPITAGGKCFVNAAGDAECADVDRAILELGDRNDIVRYSAPHLGIVNAGSGSDTFVAGLRQLTRPSQDVLTYNGGDGIDTVTYAQTDRPVTVTLGTGGNDDGRAGEHEDVGDDVEIVEGSSFDDTITGSNLEQKRERFTGGAGDDTIAGLGGPDVFHEGSTPNGRDTYNGGAGLDLVDYSQRTRPVSVSLDLNRNDGEAGEGDFIDPNVNDVFGGSAGDVITGGAGANVLIGNGGDDTLSGFGGDDRLDGGSGFDQLFGGTENDIVESADNAPDRIRCDSGQDTLNGDLQDVDATGCEVVDSVGRLELAPSALVARTGEVAKLRLSWTHPQSWKQLRNVRLRLRVRDRVVGSIAMHTRSERFTDRGAIRLERRATRLTRRGKTVTARLAFRVDGALAGRTLKTDVEATDARGRRQLERDAATVRVAR